MEANRTDRLAEALLLTLSAADRRTLLELSEPVKSIAIAIRSLPGRSVPDGCIPVIGAVVGSSVGVHE